MTMAAVRPLPRFGLRGVLGRRVHKWTAIASITSLGLLVVSAYLMPLGYMAATSLKDGAQVSEATAPLYPAKPARYTWQGQQYPVYSVPTADGVRRLAHRGQSFRSAKCAGGKRCNERTLENIH